MPTLTLHEVPLPHLAGWIHWICTACMTGLIWEVQRVHYPMFKALHTLPNAEFKQWMQFHTQRITPIVAPLMLTEALTGLWLYVSPLSPLPNQLALINIALITLIFIATAWWSVPRHHALRQNGFDEKQINRLIQSNWVRLIAWTIRLILLSVWAIHYFSVG